MLIESLNVNNSQLTEGYADVFARLVSYFSIWFYIIRESSSRQYSLDILLSSLRADTAGNDSKTAITEPWERSDGNFSGYYSKANIYYLFSQVFLSFSLNPEKKSCPCAMYHWAVIFGWCSAFNGVYVQTLQKTAGYEAFCLIMFCCFDSCSVYHPEEYGWKYRSMTLYTLQSYSLLHGGLAT